MVHGVYIREYVARNGAELGAGFNALFSEFVTRNPQPHPTIAALYLRQSVDRDNTELAVLRQCKDLLFKVAEPRKWEPVVYVENDTSALKGPRKVYEGMLQDIDDSAIQAVGVWDLDRLHRQPIELERFINLADAKALALATVGGDTDLSTDNGRLFARIKGAVAKAETDRKSVRQKAAARQLAEAGRNWTTRRPFGYELDGTIRQAEAQIIRDACDAVLAGSSLHSICKRFNETGITTATGKRWNHATQLRMILTNPRNAGIRTYNGEPVAKGNWEPIISEDVLASVTNILNNPDRRSSTTRKYLLTGIALCGICTTETEPVALWSIPPWGRRGAVYRCHKCHGIVRQQKYVDEHVLDLVRTRLQQSDAVDLLIDQKRPDVAKVRTEAAALRRRLIEIADDYADGSFTREQAKAATAKVKAKLADAERALFDANKARLFRDVVGADAVDITDLELDRQRAIIDALYTITLVRTDIRHRFDPESIIAERKL